jgi:hypothetical protein
MPTTPIRFGACSVLASAIALPGCINSLDANYQADAGWPAWGDDASGQGDDGGFPGSDAGDEDGGPEWASDDAAAEGAATDGEPQALADSAPPPPDGAGSPVTTTVPVLVNKVAAGGVSGSTLSASLAPAAGDLLVVGVYWDTAGGGTLAVSDQLGSHWVSVADQHEPCSMLSGPNTTTHVQLWYAEGVTGGADQITATLAGASQPTLGLFALEYSGVAALDVQSGKAVSTQTSEMDTGNLTTKGAADVVVALFSDDFLIGNVTAGPGYESLGLDTSYVALIEDDLPSGAKPGIYDPTASLPIANDCWVGTAVAFTGK